VVYVQSGDREELSMRSLFLNNGAVGLDASQGDRTSSGYCEGQKVQPPILVGTQKEEGSSDRLVVVLC
jgi:hypothetical protein